MSGKHFLYIIVATFITVLVWVTLNIIHSRETVKPDPEIERLLEPVNPTFDQDAINQLSI